MNRKIVCPFYRGETPTAIRCEGVFDDVSTSLLFPRKTSKDLQEDIFCANNFMCCEVYRCVLLNRHPAEYEAL